MNVQQQQILFCFAVFINHGLKPLSPEEQTLFKYAAASMAGGSRWSQSLAAAFGVIISHIKKHGGKATKQTTMRGGMTSSLGFQKNLVRAVGQEIDKIRPCVVE